MADEINPAICASCGTDYGDIELKKISVYPICSDCEVKIKNRTFPNWVKAFFGAVILIVITGFIWNWRYYMAYKDFTNSFQYSQIGDLKSAMSLVKNAQANVPEVEDFKTLYSYYHGIQLLNNDSSAYALAEFDKCKDKMPEGYYLKNLIVQARIGSSFDNKDYKGFLEASKENLELDSTSSYSYACVASAYACLYAEQNNDTFKRIALTYLNDAKNIDDTSMDAKQYYNIIEYRIGSKNIISKKEFQNKFPNGWLKN